MTEKITKAIRNAFNEYLNAVDKVILENRALQIELQRLKQENEELKRENERLKTLYRNEGVTDICESCSITSAMEAYDYRSALEEIREIAKNGNAIDGIRLKIIDKINEVLNNG